MSLYDWLIQNVFQSVDLTLYGDIVVYTTAAIAFGFILLVAKALLHVFDIFFR